MQLLIESAGTDCAHLLCNIPSLYIRKYRLLAQDCENLQIQQMSCRCDNTWQGIQRPKKYDMMKILKTAVPLRIFDCIMEQASEHKASEHQIQYWQQ